MDEYIDIQTLHGRPAKFEVPSVNPGDYFDSLFGYLVKNEVPESVLDYIITPERIMPRDYKIKRIVRLAIYHKLGDLVFHLLSKQNVYEKIYVKIKRRKCEIKRRHTIIYADCIEMYCKCDIFHMSIGYHRNGTTHVDDFSIERDAPQILMWWKIMAKLQGVTQTVKSSNSMEFSFTRIN